MHPLEGQNYDMWQQAVRTALKSKNKLGIFDGPLKRPELKEGDDPTEYNVWEMINLMIYSWIMNVIGPKLHTSIAYVETMALIWEDL